MKWNRHCRARKSLGAAKQQHMHTLADVLSQQTHFSLEEVQSRIQNFQTIPEIVPNMKNNLQCHTLLHIYDKIDTIAHVDRKRFREILHTTFNITDDVMLDLTFHAFDKNHDGTVSGNAIHGIYSKSNPKIWLLKELYDKTYNDVQGGPI